MERGPNTDFFISYTNVDQIWAEWIAWQLEQAGYTTVIQAWDFRPGNNFVQEMDTATKGAKRTIAVLSPAYLRSGFTPSEWQVAYRRDSKGEQRLLIPVRVQECDVEGLLGSIIYIDLVGHDEQEASKRLLAGVRHGRAKPTVPPAFPAVRHPLSENPAFPGAFPALWTVPYPRNPFFTGRGELLQRLGAALKTGMAPP